MTDQSSELCVAIMLSLPIVEKIDEIYMDDGKQKMRHSSVVLADNTNQVTFQVNDGTDGISINPIGADIQAIEVVNRFEPNEDDIIVMNKRSLGRQYREWILPLDQRVYVLGEISSNGDQLTIQKPLQEAFSYLITHESEEQIKHNKLMTAQKHKITSIVTFGASMVFLIFSIRYFMSL